MLDMLAKACEAVTLFRAIHGRLPREESKADMEQVCIWLEPHLMELDPEVLKRHVTGMMVDDALKDMEAKGEIEIVVEDDGRRWIRNLKNPKGAA